jgi:hypothetical protein
VNSPWPIIILFVVVAVTVFVVGSIFERRRRQDLEAFARRMGLSFTPGEVGDFFEQYAGFTPFGQGRSRRSSNLVDGRRGEVDWEFFDYRYTTGSGKNRRTHRYGIAVAKVGLAFPRMTMRPEGMFDKIASLAGFDDLNFESEEFSRRYHVKGEDRRRIYDVIHPQMMEYLLSLPAAHWQFGPGLILLIRNGCYDPAQMEGAMAAVEGFLSRVPSYVRDDLARQ